MQKNIQTTYDSCLTTQILSHVTQVKIMKHILIVLYFLSFQFYKKWRLM